MFLRFALEVVAFGVFNYQILPPGCGTRYLLIIYYLGILIFQFVQIILGIAIAKKSMKGTIANPVPRMGMNKLLKAKFIFWDFELLWVILGTYIGFGDGAMHACYRAVQWIIRIIAMSGWAMVVVTVVAFCAAYDSTGGQPVRMGERRKKKCMLT